MPFTIWNPQTQISRGFVTLGVADVIADINAPVLTELEDSTVFQCATEAFNNSSSTDSTTIDWLCSPESESLPGSTTYEIEALKIKIGNPQDETLTSEAFVPGTTKYLWRRDGLPQGDALAADQKVWIWEVSITSIDPAPVANAAGDYLAITVNIAVRRRSIVASTIIAGP